jgi:hypothetical protein
MRTTALFLLQGLELSDFQLQPSPVQGILFFAGVTIVVLLVVFINKSAKIRNSEVFKSGVINKPQLRVPGFKGLKNAARKYGFDYEEQKFLSDLFQKQGVETATVFNSIENIDREFAKLIQALEKEDDMDNDIAKLLAIRNKIEYSISAAAEMEKLSEKNFTIHRYKRVETHIPAVFYLVVEKEVRQGLKMIKKLLLDSKKHTGTILNISSGGCAISTSSSLKAGGRIKLEFKMGKTNAAALAQILRVNKNQSGSVLHLRFLKVSAKSLNAINIFVYNYKNL